jgi:DNA polymerase III epsilon subunit-like protein
MMLSSREEAEQELDTFKQCLALHHRTLDPAMLYTLYTDPEPPSMKTCMERAGFEGEVAHTALEDALMVIRLLRHKLIPQRETHQENR